MTVENAHGGISSTDNVVQLVDYREAIAEHSFTSVERQLVNLFGAYLLDYGIINDFTYSSSSPGEPPVCEYCTFEDAAGECFLVLSKEENSQDVLLLANFDRLDNPQLVRRGPMSMLLEGFLGFSHNIIDCDLEARPRPQNDNFVVEWKGEPIFTLPSAAMCQLFNGLNIKHTADDQGRTVLQTQTHTSVVLEAQLP